MRRSVVVLFLLAPAAFAQGSSDDWNKFPATAPPAAPAPSVAPAASAAAVPPAEAPVVSTQERVVPGTEPHSPATRGNTLEAKANLRLAAGKAGVGLLHLGSADLGPKGIVRFSAIGEYFNQFDFPVRNATNVRSAGTFAASFVPVEWAEIYLGYGASANTNSSSSPRLIQALGDITLGGKLSRRWARGFFAGADLRLLSFSGVGNQSVDRYALGFAPRLLATYDVREPLPKVPARLHANLGMIFDGTGALARSHKLRASEEFALGVNQYHRLAFGIGVEAPLPWVTPFVEYNLAYPLGVENGTLIGPDGVPISVSQAMPQTLGVGLKITAVKDLTLLAAADFGFSRSVGLGVPATPPYNLLLGASFNVDPFQRGETKIVETVRERPVQPVAPPVSRVEGTVVDASTGKPINGAIVALVGAQAPPVATDAAAGRFVTHDLAPGTARLRVAREGYQEALTEVMLAEGQTATIQVALQPAVKKAHFAVSVTSKKKSVSAIVHFTGPVEHQATTGAGGEGVQVDLLPGKYTVTVAADGYLAQTRDVQASENAKMEVAFELQPQPKKKLVVVKENKIDILQQVHFASGKATILADSTSLLQQVVDAIVTNNIKRIRIEGHTDNRGGKAKNQRLSEQRAAAVADFLVTQGIDRSRIESVGYGDTRPVAPNLTARGREMNRRVEFVIIER